MRLQDFHTHHGATVAPDGIPLHYGDLSAEYQAAINTAILLDRSHEGRIQLSGDDRLKLLNRMSTNDTLSLKSGMGQPTIFTTPNARIIDRVVAYELNETTTLITEPGRNSAVSTYLQRNIFFGDQVKLQDVTGTTHQLNICGPTADAVVSALGVDLTQLSAFGAQMIPFADTEILVVKRKPLHAPYWALIVNQAHAVKLYEHVLSLGAEHGLQPAGSLTYNALRIRAGRPAGRELSGDYIPLEVGLWDEVSFTKGCYTGQEIIARMESRQKLARTIVALELSEMVEAPAQLTYENSTIGTLTSSVTAPDGQIYAIGIIKVRASEADTLLNAGSVKARVIERIGVQPPQLMEG